MLSLPAGEYTLTAPLAIARSRVVLRGAGTGDSAATVLSIPQSERGRVASVLSIPQGERRELQAHSPPSGPALHASWLEVTARQGTGRP